MLPKPPEPHIGSIDGDRYISLSPYMVNFADWMSGIQFEIYQGTVTDIASIPRPLRWMYDRASLGITAPFLHDFLCTSRGKYTNTMGQEMQLSWFDVHLFFLVAMRLDGIAKRRAFLAFLAVVLCNRPIW
jgi:Protein of unknown function (DUF1353)